MTHSDTDQLSDAMSRLSRGQAGAMRAVYDLTAPHVYGKLVKLLKDEVLARRAMHQTYVRLWHLRALITKSDAADREKISAIAHRCALEIRSSRKRTSGVIGGLPGKDLSGRETGEGVALHKLDDRDRDILMSAYLEFASPEAIASRHGMAPAEVRERLAVLTRPAGGGGHG